jgi:adenosylcobinamide-phosphate synthase
LLKMLFSLSGLIKAAHQIQCALERRDLDEARRLVGWHLVSRDTSRLSDAYVAAATIESVAENACDGVIAPLWYYALGGLPGALTYRFVSTCDSMWGYRNMEYEWLGKVAARLDDLLNLLPARLTATLIVVAALFLGENARTAWCIWRRDAAITASPNAGHPMSAMAGALGVELEKIGHYRLGQGLRHPRAQDIRRATRLTTVCCGLAMTFIAILAWLLQRYGDTR